MTKSSGAAPRQRSPHTGPAYEADVYSWALHQAELLREGRLAEADVANIAEEILDVGRSEYRELRSALARVIQHLLKWDFQPERRSPSWRNSIRVQRLHARQTLNENPGLRHKLDDILAEAYEMGVAYVVEDTGLDIEALPTRSPYDYDTIMTREISLSAGQSS